MFRTFGLALGTAVAGLVLGGVYDGGTGLLVVAVLAVLETSLSFDNAVVNATVLVRMSPFWQRLFLTVGIAVAVFGMRLVFPLLIVGVTARVNPFRAVQLAWEKGDPETPGTYGYLLRDAHPAIAAFGGVFLLLLFLGFLFRARELTWLTWVERPLQRLTRIALPAAMTVAVGVLLVAVFVLATPHKRGTVLVAGLIGLVAFLAVDTLGRRFTPEDNSVPAAGRAAFVLFLYIEVLDASFSLDGVVGAFAITADPVLIMIGLGVGAMFIRSLTLFLVRRGTLAEYEYLEHGALWAIGVLAVLLLVTLRHDVPEVVTGSIGAAFIVAAFASSVIRRRRAATQLRPEAADWTERGQEADAAGERARSDVQRRTIPGRDA